MLICKNLAVSQILGEVNGVIRQLKMLFKPLLVIFGVSSSSLYPLCRELSSHHDLLDVVNNFMPKFKKIMPKKTTMTENLSSMT